MSDPLFSKSPQPLALQGSSQKIFKAGWWFKSQSIVVVLLHSYDHIK